MTKINPIYLSILIPILLFSFSASSQNSPDRPETNYYSQGTNNRTAAEWEPALGTLIVWPLSIPYKLAIELAKDNHLFTMLEDEEARAEAEKWYQEWGINLDDVTFIYAQQGVDAWWTRDWGPSAVFTESGEYRLADGKYIYATPFSDLECNDSLRFQFSNKNNDILLTIDDDEASLPLADQLGFELMDLPFNNTGGNVLTDGIGTAFSTCVIKAENKFHGIDSKTLLELNDSLLGFKRYHIISNFEKMGIQHIDCLLKLIDEESILVAEPPPDHELFGIYDKIVNDELSKLRTPYGNPYRILRIKTAPYRKDYLAAYTNSLILNKKVYVPLFDIPQDSSALKTWEEAMPGYEIKGFTFALDDEPIVTDKMRRHYRNYGWNDGDALHCRTRAIWNPEMLFISVNQISSKVNPNEKNMVYTTIIDYSKQGLLEDECRVYWRVLGEEEWKSQRLTPTENDAHFFGQIPNQVSGITIEYYISAVSKSGERETRPVTAPRSIYTFSVE